MYSDLLNYMLGNGKDPVEISDRDREVRFIRTPACSSINPTSKSFPANMPASVKFLHAIDRLHRLGGTTPPDVPKRKTARRSLVFW